MPYLKVQVSEEMQQRAKELASRLGFKTVSQMIRALIEKTNPVGWTDEGEESDSSGSQQPLIWEVDYKVEILGRPFLHPALVLTMDGQSNMLPPIPPVVATPTENRVVKKMTTPGRFRVLLPGWEIDVYQHTVTLAKVTMYNVTTYLDVNRYGNTVAMAVFDHEPYLLKNDELILREVFSPYRVIRRWEVSDLIEGDDRGSSWFQFEWGDDHSRGTGFVTGMDGYWELSLVTERPEGLKAVKSFVDVDSITS